MRMAVCALAVVAGCGMGWAGECAKSAASATAPAATQKARTTAQISGDGESVSVSVVDGVKTVTVSAQGRTVTVEEGPGWVAVKMVAKDEAGQKAEEIKGASLEEIARKSPKLAQAGKAALERAAQSVSTTSVQVQGEGPTVEGDAAAAWALGMMVEALQKQIAGANADQRKVLAERIRQLEAAREEIMKAAANDPPAKD